MKKQKENSHEGITWSEMGKQNVQAEKVYWKEHNSTMWPNKRVKPVTVNTRDGQNVTTITEASRIGDVAVTSSGFSLIIGRPSRIFNENLGFQVLQGQFQIRKLTISVSCVYP